MFCPMDPLVHPNDLNDPLFVPRLIPHFTYNIKAAIVFFLIEYNLIFSQH